MYVIQFYKYYVLMNQFERYRDFWCMIFPFCVSLYKFSTVKIFVTNYCLLMMFCIWITALNY